MRINLDCPYSEKDDAKRLGAKWDMARKTWYVEDPEDLTPFARWIKGLGRPTDHQAKKEKKRSKSIMVTGGRNYVQTTDTPGLLPWEDEDPHELIALVREIGLS
jgi:Domain of unknown function (DUF5710)